MTTRYNHWDPNRFTPEARQRRLRDLGILPAQDEPGDAELRRSDPEAYRQMIADRAEVSKLEADEAYVTTPPEDDPADLWMWPNGIRPTH